MKNGKLVKPPGWTTSVADLHEGVKKFVGVNISLDMCVEGATTCQGLARLTDEVWPRAPVKTEPYPVLRVAVVSWCCNDHSTFEKQGGGRYKCKPSTNEMRAAANSLRDRLDRYDAGIVLGPGSADTWNIDSSWGTGAKELLELMLPFKFHVWQSARVLERRGEGG